MFLATLFLLTSYITVAHLHPLTIESNQENKSIVFSDYKNEILPPTIEGAPITVDFGMRVIDINSINVEDMDFRMDMFLTQEWTDHRITIPEELFDNGDNFIILPTQYSNSLWQPDLYFLNSKVVEIATLTHSFSSIILFRNKTVRYTARMHAIVACQMEFQNYPMDTQICPMSVESFSYDVKRMKLRWSESGVTVSPELKLLQYNIKDLQLKELTVLATDKIGDFSRLIVYFRFERQIGHHLIQTFAPSTLIVAISWFSFWIGLDAIPGRITLLVTCLLTLVTMFTGLRSDIPAVAYVKALDVWMAGCMLFVFAALGEFVIVKLSSRYYEEDKKYGREVAAERAIHYWSTEKDLRLFNTPKRKSRIIKHSWHNNNGKETILWLKIDKMSAVIFPVLFLTFIILYWSILFWVNM